MSQEIQLSLTPPSGSAVPQTNSWSGPAMSTLAASPMQQTPLAAVHRHLRGRYGVAILLAIVFGGIGAAVGFMLLRPGYQSIGLIEIDPVIRLPELYDKIMPMYNQYVQTVVTRLHSERVLKAAMQSSQWKAHRPFAPEAYLGDWNKDLLVRTIPNSYYIQIIYTDDRKDGQVVAPIAVSSLIKAYKDLYGDEEKFEIEQKIGVWRKAGNVLNQQISHNRSFIDQLLQNIGEDPQNVLNEKWHAQVVLEAQVRELGNMLSVERDELKKAQENEATQPYTLEDLARVDSSMQEMYRIQKQEELEVQILESRGTLNPAARAARQRLDARNAAMNKYGDELREKYFIKWKPDGTGGVLMSKDLSIKEADLKRYQDQYAQQKQYLDDLGRRSHDVKTYRDQLKNFDDDLVRVNKKIDEFTTEEEFAETLKVTDSGGQAVLANDKRYTLGAVGFLVAAGCPVGLMLLASLMNPRFRYSDEATGQPATGGLTLLGILPDLPDRLSDPEQASIAAHCVHQIRTMLQINTGTDERRVFAITSAAPGDGKTSLTLALGLSYAACGTRTLLIDCDLIGAGLTSRMNVASGDGVLEAIAHRSLLEYVRSTDIADVSILPVGSGQHLHASTLSPAALRRLIEEAKKHFDTVLIDTGPVLGSIEASLVAGAADAVVLTVSRGQPRPLVEKSIQHLQHIKANLAGVVFNRAQTSDFDSSISGISLRSAAAGHGHNGPRMGPVARAVQSAFKPAGGDNEDMN